MEPWQKTNITKNLPDLLSLTSCEIHVLVELKSESLLSDFDIESIKSEKTIYDQAHKLYSILQTRDNSYYKLISALLNTNQTGAAKLLLQIPIERMGEWQVSFLGNVKILKNLLDMNQIQNINAWLTTNLSTEDLIRLHKTTLEDMSPIQLLRDSVPAPHPLYIPRLLSRRLYLDPEIFNEECEDIFVVKNAKRVQLRSFVSSYGIESSTQELLKSRISVRFILLDVESDWEKICDKVQNPAHLIKYEESTKTFLLEATSSYSAKLRRYLKSTEEYNAEKEDSHISSSDDDLTDTETSSNVSTSSSESDNESKLSDMSDIDSDQTDTSEDDSDYCKNSEEKRNAAAITEDELVESIITENVKNVCFCGSPGTGKSLLLASLARKVNNKCQDSIVAYIQLRHFDISVNPNYSTLDSAKSLLLEHLATSVVTKCILLELLNKNNVKYKLFLDGLDEVHETQIDSVCKFIKSVIKNIPTASICVTSRIFVRSTLEDTLGVIAFDIKPFNKVTQIDFLVTYWASKQPNTNIKKLIECAKFFLMQTKRFLNKKENYITGVPLLCMLIAKVYCSKACIYADKNRKCTVKLSPTFANSLTEIYSEFVCLQLGESKCGLDCLFMENILQCDQKCKIRSFHVWQAAKFIIPNVAILLREHIGDFSALSLQEILSPGILEETECKSSFQFLHQTIAEYLVADFIWSVFLLNFPKNRNLTYFEKFEQFIYLAIFAPSCELKNNFREIVLTYFLNAIMVKNYSNFKVRCSAAISPLYDTYFSSLNACIVADYEGLLELFMKATENCKSKFYDHINLLKTEKRRKLPYKWQNKSGDYDELTFTDEIAKHIMQSSAKYCNAKTVDKLYKFFLSVLHIDLYNYVWPPPIEIAIKRTDYELVHYFAEKMPLENQTLLYLCLKNTYNMRDEFVEKRIEIAQLLLKKCPNLLIESWDVRIQKYKDAYKQAYKLHLLAIKFLVDTCANQGVSNKFCYFLIFPAATYMSDEKLSQLFRLLFADNSSATEFFLDPLNWIDVSNDFKNWEHDDSVFSLYRIFVFLKIETKFVDKLISFLKLENSKICKSVFYGLLYTCIYKENLEFTSLLLANDDLVPEWKHYDFGDGMTATLLAALYGSLDILKFFVSKGAGIFDVENQGQTVLHLGAPTKGCDFFKSLVLMVGGMWNHTCESTFNTSHCQGEEAIKDTPENLYDLFNWPTLQESKTPLHYAILWISDLSLETLELLVVGGISSKIPAQAATCVTINARDHNGATALHLALYKNRSLDLVKRLISLGADWTLRDNPGCNVAHFCAIEGLPEHLSYFLELGCDVNKVCENGNNALQCGLGYYYKFNAKHLLEIVQLLLKAGVDKTNKNKDGETAYDIAVKYNRPTEVLNLLKQKSLEGIKRRNESLLFTQ